MKKKILALFMVAAMTMTALTGCGNSKDAENAESTTSIMETTQGIYADKKVGVSIGDFDNSFSKSFREELLTYLISIGFAEENIIIMKSDKDQATQNNQVHNFIVDGFDVVMVDLVSAKAAPELTDLAVAANIPLIYLNHQPEKEEMERWADSEWKVSFVGTESAQAGRMQGKVITDLGLKAVDFNKNDKVDYIMVEGDQNNADYKNRTEKSIKAIKNKDIAVKSRGEIAAEGDQVKAQQQVASLLADAKKGGKIDVIICNNDDMALGAMQAIEVSKRTVGKDIALIGADGSVDALKAVLAGTMTATVFNDYISQAHTAADSAVRFIKGEKNEPTVYVKYVKVDQTNAQEILVAILGEDATTEEATEATTEATTATTEATEATTETTTAQKKEETGSEATSAQKKEETASTEASTQKKEESDSTATTASTEKQEESNPATATTAAQN